MSLGVFLSKSFHATKSTSLLLRKDNNIFLVTEFVVRINFSFYSCFKIELNFYNPLQKYENVGFMFLHRTAALFIIGNYFRLQQDLLFANLLGHTISSMGESLLVMYKMSPYYM